MRIAVGSKNPVKVAAVRNVVTKFWSEAEVVGIEVDHGTNIQPKTHEEAIQGATKRAELSLKQANADFGFGLEGNTVDTEHGMFLAGWVVAVNKNGERGIAANGTILLPEKIAEKVRQGMELGPACDEVFGTHNVKQKEGSVGVLTKGIITRTRAFEQGVACALARFLHPELYK
jgi:inosine/xanthosine triphosphatase